MLEKRRQNVVIYSLAPRQLTPASEALTIYGLTGMLHQTHNFFYVLKAEVNNPFDRNHHLFVLS